MSNRDQINLSEILFQINEIFRFLLKQKISIILFVILGSALGIFYSTTIKTKYSSTLSFVIEGENYGGGLASLANSFGFGRAGNSQGVFNNANILELLKTKKLLQKALLEPSQFDKNKSLADEYIEFNQWRKKWEDEPKLKDIHFAPYTPKGKLTLQQNQILSKIYSSLSRELKVEHKNPDNSIIYIDLETTSETFTKHFPELLIKVVSQYYIESKTRKAKANYETLKKQTDSVRNELYSSISGVAVANDNTFFLNPAFNVKRVPSAHKEVSVQANQIILGELVKNLELARMNLLNETPFIEIIDSPVLPLQKHKFGKIKGALIGGILGGFIIVSFFVLRIFWRKTKSNIKLMKENLKEELEQKKL